MYLSCFRPHQGIILFNENPQHDHTQDNPQVSVPIRGLFYLTVIDKEGFRTFLVHVSVPIRGLFYLTLSLKQQIFTSSKMQKTAEIVNPPQKAL